MDQFNDEKYVKNLYKWNKNADLKLKNKIKESDNIQSIHQWLRKVEDASETAIKTTFNLKQPSSTRSNNSSAIALNSNSDPSSEAHDLINQWITDKIRLDMDDDFYNYVDISEVNQFNNNEKVLDQLRSELFKNEDDDNITSSILDIKGVDYDKYDEDYIAKDIINKIMKKKFVDTKKLGVDEEKRKKIIDTQMKIEMRHQAVKENREKRQRELEQKRKEKLERKEIELKAKQIVQKEEHDKKMRLNIEQQLIEQEVQRLRLEMAEQRQRDESARRKQIELENIRMEREKQEMLNVTKKQDIMEIESAIEAKRNEMAEKRSQDLVDSYLKAKKMRLLQRVFSSWYGLVLDSGIKNGKAKALADWKLTYKVFNGWKKISIVEKVKKDQELYQNLVKVENVKLAKAARYHKNKLMQKMFDEWRNFTRNQLILKQIENDKLKTKNKMKRFLEAVAVVETSKQLEEEDNVDNARKNLEIPLITTRSAKSNKSTSRDGNSLRKSRSFENLNSKSSSKLNSSKRTIKTPKSSKITSDNLLDASSFFNDAPISNINFEKKVKEMMWPWVKTPFVNNFDNRFKAQEKMLHEQQRMMKDQQKIIEELKFQQGQAAFKEQIALLNQIKEKQLELEKMQKLQYKQEKALLRQQADIKRFEKSKVKPKNSNDKSEEHIADDENGEYNLKLDLSNNDDSIKDEVSTEKKDDVVWSSRLASSQKNPKPNQQVKFNDFHKNMEERAKMREQMKREREEKRKKQEIERLELLKAQQEEKLKVEEEERQRKNEELKEKKRIQRELEEKRNSEKQKEQSLLIKADEHYKKYLIRYYGMNGFKILIEFRRAKIDIAVRHHASIVLKKAITMWHFNVKLDLDVKKSIADMLNRKLTLRSCFSKIKQFKKQLQIGEAKAIRFYKYHIKLKLFEAWKVYKLEEKKKYGQYELLVHEHNLLRLKTVYFSIWRQHPAEMKRQRLRQKRLDQLRSKVREVLPDFESPTNASSATASSFQK